MTKQTKRRLSFGMPFVFAGIAVLSTLLLINSFDQASYDETLADNGSLTIDNDEQEFTVRDFGTLDFSDEDLLSIMDSLQGTIYNSEENDPKSGLSPSGFVQYAYEESTGIRLPVSARNQRELGESLSVEALQTGDLVFFQADTLISGIYAGDGTFFTSTLSNGVEKLNLSEDSFWGDRFLEGKRLSEKELEALHPGTYAQHEHPAVQQSIQYLDVPYEFGGNTMAGFDCSFFVQEVFKESVDLRLPRVTVRQFNFGEDIISFEELQAGDVMYFNSETVDEGRRKDWEVNHTGIYLGNGFMIHAGRTENRTQITQINDFWKDTFEGAKRFHT